MGMSLQLSFPRNWPSFNVCYHMGCYSFLMVLYVISLGTGSREEHGGRHMGGRSHAGRKIWQSLGPELSLN